MNIKLIIQVNTFASHLDKPMVVGKTADAVQQI